MAETKGPGAVPEAKPEKPAATKRFPRKFLLPGIIAGGVILGGAVGSQILAPKLFGGSTPQAGSPKELPKHRPGAAAAEHTGGTIHQIENIIVNPAGAKGSRFLMATVAIELPTPEDEQQLRVQEVRVRDKIISLLESQSMEMLTQPGARDSLKRRLADALWPMVPDAEWVEIYLPQFVIQ